jgi:hypothetical protein
MKSSNLYSMGMMCFANSFASAVGWATLSSGQQATCGLIMFLCGLVLFIQEERCR